MIKIKNTKVYGLEESITRSGYPMQTDEPDDLDFVDFDMLNAKHITRAEKLANTSVGSGHNNFLKGIIVQFDLQYPEYFSPQLQRYNFVDIISSQSKMHCLTKIKNLSESCNKFVLTDVTNLVSIMIENYNNPDIKYPVKVDWDGCMYANSREELFQYIISNLPSGYLKWMGISTNYLQLKTIYNQRCKHKHKLKEWQEFGEFIESLPMSELIIS